MGNRYGYCIVACLKARIARNRHGRFSVIACHRDAHGRNIGTHTGRICRCSLAEGRSKSNGSAVGRKGKGRDLQGRHVPGDGDDIGQ